MLAGLYKGFLANVVRSVGGALVLVGGPQLTLEMLVKGGKIMGKS